MLVRPSKVAKELGVTTETIYNWIRAGKIRAYRTPTGRLLIEMEDVKQTLVEVGGDA